MKRFVIPVIIFFVIATLSVVSQPFNFGSSSTSTGPMVSDLWTSKTLPDESITFTNPAAGIFLNDADGIGINITSAGGSINIKSSGLTLSNAVTISSPNMLTVQGGAITLGTGSAPEVLASGTTLQLFSPGNNVDVFGATITRITGLSFGSGACSVQATVSNLFTTNVIGTSGMTNKVRVITSSDTLTYGDTYLLVSNTTLTATLPSAVGMQGKDFLIKLVKSGTTATVATTSSQTIDGSTTFSLASQNKYIRVVSDGANWYNIGSN